MDTEVIKKKLQKQNPLMMSPMAFALAACGGGGSDGAGTSTQTVARLSSSTFGLTGDDFIDAMTQGSKWDTNNGTMKIALANGFNGEEWDNPQDVNNSLVMAMVAFEKFSNIELHHQHVVYDTPTDAANAGATIIFSLDGTFISEEIGNQGWAIGHFPNYPDELFENQAGTMFVNINSQANFLSYSAYEPGGAGYTLLLHELGHALGLKHPHDSGGSGRPTFDDIGLGNFDRDDFTVMSYEEQFNDILNAPRDFMVADAIALMYLYGIPENFDSFSQGDPNLRHTHIATKEPAHILKVENGGSIEVVLPNEQITPLVDINVGWITDLNTGATSWLLGEYHNIICSNGDYRIFGNDKANNIEAGAGDDYIDGGRGNDLLHGYKGADVFVLGQNYGNDIISDFEPGIDQMLFLDDDRQADSSLASYSENADGVAVYTLADGSSFTLLGIGFDVTLIA